MQRRDFIAGLVGATAASSLAVHAQQGAHVRRIGVLVPANENDPEAKALLSGFTQVLAELGPKVATYGWTFVGPPAALKRCGRSQKSWSTCDPK